MNKALKCFIPAISFSNLYYVGTYLSAERCVPIFYVLGSANLQYLCRSYISIGKRTSSLLSI